MAKKTHKLIGAIRRRHVCPHAPMPGGTAAKEPSPTEPVAGRGRRGTQGSQPHARAFTAEDSVPEYV